MTTIKAVSVPYGESIRINYFLKEYNIHFKKY